MSKCHCDCGEKENCRYYIDYEEDDNCALVAVEKNGRMTLEEIGERLDVSYEWVRKLEERAINKMQEKIGEDWDEEMEKLIESGEGAFAE